MTSATGKPVGVLFVCLGNICRSPLAKCIFESKVEKRGMQHLFAIDSCGTGGWHEGNGADPRSVWVAASRGIELVHTARQVRAASDMAFDFVVAMDRANRRDLLKLGFDASRVHLMRQFDPALTASQRPEADLDVPDPYYGGDSGFETVYSMLDDACEGLIKACLDTRNLRA